MKQTTLMLLLTAFIFSCSKTTTPTPSGPSGSSAFATLFPHIDTATIHWYGVGRPTASYMKITESGTVTITSIGEPQVGGTYKLRLTDSSVGGYYVKTFDLLRGGVDTVISSNNGIGIAPASGSARAYYWIQINGGNLGVNDIFRGDFIDSI